MSKPVKNLMIRDYQDRLEGVSDALVISVRGVPGIENNRMRVALAQKNIRVTVVRNNLARHAFKDTPLAALERLFDGPTALAYGGESVVDVAREIAKFAKDLANLELKGAILDGELFEGKAGVERLSRFPTRDEALAQTVTLILSPAQKLVGQVKGPGGRVMGIIKTIEEKLEKGEAVAKTA